MVIEGNRRIRHFTLPIVWQIFETLDQSQCEYLEWIAPPWDMVVKAQGEFMLVDFLG